MSGVMYYKRSFRALWFHIVWEIFVEGQNTPFSMLDWACLFPPKVSRWIQTSHRCPAAPQRPKGCKCHQSIYTLDIYIYSSLLRANSTISNIFHCHIPHGVLLCCMCDLTHVLWDYSNFYVCHREGVSWLDIYPFFHMCCLCILMWSAESRD